MRNLIRLCTAALFVVVYAQQNEAKAQIYLNYAVNQPALLTANAGTDQLICNGESVTLGSTPTGNGGTGAYTYVWSPGGSLNNAAASNPIATPSQSTIYMLSITDAQGCSFMDSIEILVDTCVGIQPASGMIVFEVYPNPNDGKFTVAIELPQPFPLVKLTVIDLAGRIIYARELQNPGLMIHEQFALQGLSRGTYSIQLEADGKQISKKMILR